MEDLGPEAKEPDSGNKHFFDSLTHCPDEESAEEHIRNFISCLGLNHERPEVGLLQNALMMLYSYHSPPGDHIEKQREYEHQNKLAALHLENSDEREETKQDNVVAEDLKAWAMQPFSDSDEELTQRFRSRQLSEAKELVKNLSNTLNLSDPLLPLVLCIHSEILLKDPSQQDPYKQCKEAMHYATTAILVYQKVTLSGFKTAVPMAAMFYERFLIFQQQHSFFTGIPSWHLAHILADYRENLAKHREDLRLRLNQIKTGLASEECISSLAAYNTRFFIDFTKALWNKALEIFQKEPPCEYAILGLGSMSKEEMCPYSDLEFALLLERNDPETHEFFLTTVHIMHLLVIALGETPTNESNSKVVVRGYRFDEGGNVPLNDLFITTPEALAAIQLIPTNDDRRDPGPIARNVLRTTTYISGNQSLYEQYQQFLMQHLLKGTMQNNRWSNWLYPHQPEQIQKLRNKALEDLESACRYFSIYANIDYKEPIKNMRFCMEIKSTLYRFPTQLLDSLTLYYGTKGNSSSEKIRNLQNENKISAQTAKKLTQAIEIAMQFRMDAQLYYKSEEDQAYYLANEASAQMLSDNVYLLDEHERAQLLIIYQILIPLEFAAREFISSKGKNNFFTQEELWSQLNLLSSDIGQFNAALSQNEKYPHHLTICNYETLQWTDSKKIFNIYHLALYLDPDNLSIHLCYLAYLQKHIDTLQKATPPLELKKIQEYQNKIEDSLTRTVYVLISLANGDIQEREKLFDKYNERLRHRKFELPPKINYTFQNIANIVLEDQRNSTQSPAEVKSEGPIPFLKAERMRLKSSTSSSSMSNDGGGWSHHKITSTLKHGKKDRSNLMHALKQWELRGQKERPFKQKTKLGMKSRADYFGYNCQAVPLEGRCFYHAFFLQLRQKIPARYRNLTVEEGLDAIVKHIVKHWPLYDELIQERYYLRDLNHFIDMLLNDSTALWADYIFILAATRAFNVDVVIIADINLGDPVVFRRRNPDGQICLGHQKFEGERERCYQVLERNQEIVQPTADLGLWIDRAAVDDWGSKLLNSRDEPVTAEAKIPDPAPTVASATSPAATSAAPTISASSSSSSNHPAPQLLSAANATQSPPQSPSRLSVFINHSLPDKAAAVVSPVASEPASEVKTIPPAKAERPASFAAAIGTFATEKSKAAAAARNARENPQTAGARLPTISENDGGEGNKEEGGGGVEKTAVQVSGRPAHTRH